MQRRKLGTSGPVVSAIGLGCMGMSDLYGPADDAESIATIRAALDAGVTLLDTGDYYGMGHNELLIREALAQHDRDQVILSVKFGALRDPKGAWLGFDARPAAVKTFLAYTLKRLGTDHVDCRVDCSAGTGRRRGRSQEMTSARTRLDSPVRTSSAIWRSSRRCSRLGPDVASPSRSSPSPGSSLAVPTSFRSSERGAERRCWNHSQRPT